MFEIQSTPGFLSSTAKRSNHDNPRGTAIGNIYSVTNHDTTPWLLLRSEANILVTGILYKLIQASKMILLLLLPNLQLMTKPFRTLVCRSNWAQDGCCAYSIIQRGIYYLMPRGAIWSFIGGRYFVTNYYHHHTLEYLESDILQQKSNWNFYKSFQVLLLSHLNCNLEKPFSLDSQI